jgi:pimeloyl-ACP methyl ester carboxylesterase
LLNDGLESFYIDFLKEVGGEEKAELRPEMTIGEARCIDVSADENGYVDLVKIFGETFEKFWRLRYGVAYAYTEIDIDREDSYVLLIGSEDYVSVYVNNVHIFTSHIARRYMDSFYALPIKLHKGINKILIKIGRLAGGWGFSAKLDETSSPIYVNRERTILPEPPQGSLVAEWIGLHVLAIRDVSFKVRCVEDDMWHRCETDPFHLYGGERIQIPLFIMSKKPIEVFTKIKIVFDVDEHGSYEHEFIIKPSNDPVHRIYTYRSLYDGSVHRYGVKTPVNYDPSRRYPAIIILHGFKGLQMYTQIYGDKDWCISIAPTARDGEVNYREIGLLEVFEVLNDVKKRYKIDDEKIHLIGHSMGGYGTWHIGVKKPDMFASLAPHSGRGDLSDMVARLIKISGWEGIARLLDRYNPSRYIKNLSETPVYIAHGSEDDIVPVEYSRNMAKLLDSLGYKYVYEEIKDKKHWWGSYKPGSYYGAEAIDRPQLDEFMRNTRRRYPRRVIAVSDDIRFNRYWWIILRSLTYKDLGYIDIEILDPHMIRINDVREITSFSIDFDELCKKELLDCESPISLVYKDKLVKISNQFISKDLRILIDDSDRLCVYDKKMRLKICSDETIHLVSEEPEERLSKNILPGPFMDIFNDRTLIISCNDHELKDVCRKTALHIQYWWLDYANGIVKISDEKDVLDKDLHKKFNIIAVGGPEINRYVDKALENIRPIKILGECVLIRDRKYCGREIGTIFIYPNPLADYKKYMAVIGANTRETIASATRVEYTMIPDYIVYDSRYIGIRYEGLIDSGFFDVGWQ